MYNSWLPLNGALALVLVCLRVEKITQSLVKQWFSFVGTVFAFFGHMEAAPRAFVMLVLIKVLVLISRV
jgi:hypothetical protein